MIRCTLVLTVLVLAAQPAAAAPEWWRALGGDPLTELVEAALDRHGDLRSQRLNLDATDARRGSALSPMLPSVSIDASLNASPLASVGFDVTRDADGVEVDPVKVLLTPSARGALFLRARWSVDPGRTWSSYRAAGLSTEAARAELEQRRAQIAQAVSVGWLDYTTAVARVALLERQLARQRKLLDLVEERFAAGQVANLDVLQQREQIARAEGSLPPARAEVVALRDQLFLFTGVDPGEPAALPPLPPEPDLEVNLAETRPGLRALDARTAAASAAKTAAFLAFFPTLAVTASAGAQSRWQNDTSTLPTWGLGATLSVPLFDGGDNRSRHQAAGAEHRAAEERARWARAVAASEVRVAAAREGSLIAALSSVEARATTARAAAEEASARYGAGLTAYPSVLTAQSSADEAEQALVDARRNLLANRVSLYVVLGGSI